jgi:hypothetical protein
MLWRQNQFATIDIAPRPAISIAAFRVIRGWKRKVLMGMIPNRRVDRRFVTASYCSAIKNRFASLS